MKNIAFHYLYRDGSNNKNCGQAVFANPTSLATDDLEALLVPWLDGEEYFIASQIEVPEIFLWSKDAADYDPDDPATYPKDLGPGRYQITSEDHCWHEFSGLLETEDQPTDTRTISEFLSAVEQASTAGWREFQVGEE